MRSSGILVLIIVAASLSSCKTEEIILHGDITGFVTDAETSQPILAASVKLNNTNDTTATGTDGSFLLKNIVPDNYEIQSTKIGYGISKKNVAVIPAKTQQIDFPLNGIPIPNPSVTFLDFGQDSTSLRFSISNIGKGKFGYRLIPSKDWITVSPSNGDITNETENIIVTINKTGLSDSIYKETLKVISFAGQAQLTEIIIPLYLNGVRDRDGNYYKIVRIGTQIWMGENLNVGVSITAETYSYPSNNGIIEKYCSANATNYCNTYGGLYSWYEMMQYNPSDTGLIGTTQGICPVGWHIPTENEWSTLFDYLGGGGVAGGKLKEEGLTHWNQPNFGGTNEIGFSALPGGYFDPIWGTVRDIGLFGYWWTAKEYPTPSLEEAYVYTLSNSVAGVTYSTISKMHGNSVRCVKNPGKK